MSIRVLSGFLLATLVSACAVDASPEDTDQAVQDVLFPCTGTQIWTRYYYQNGLEVGRQDCNCGSTEIISHGTLAGSPTHVWGPTCGGSPNPPPPSCLVAPSVDHSGNIVRPPPPPGC